MTRAARAGLHLACAALACLWLGCEDEGVIGTQGAQTCPQDCPAGLHCDPDLRQCVECAEDGECPEGAPFCEGFSCAECRQAADCPDDAPRCAAGSCGACGEDADCNAGRTAGQPERHCEDGACVAEDEQETDADHAQSGGAGDDSEEAGSGSEEE